MQRRARFQLLVLSFVAAAAACAGENGGKVGTFYPPQDDTGTDDKPEVHDGGPTEGSTLDVTLSASAPSVCRGQCVDLGAQATLGLAPYHFVWDHGLPSSAGPHRVCPTETTRYQVSVTDSGSQGVEFSAPRGEVSKAIEITVDETCHAPGNHVCSANWTLGGPDVFPTWPAVAADREGNALVTGSFIGQITLGQITLSSDRLTGFLAKLGPDCAPLWMRALPSNQAVLAFDVAADPRNSEIMVSGRYLGTLDLDDHDVPGSATAGRWQAFLARFATDGTLRWAKGFGSSLPAVRAFDLSAPRVLIKSSGQIVLTGDSPPDVDFGGGQLSPSGAATIVAAPFVNFAHFGYAVEFDPSGKHRFTLPGATPSAVLGVDGELFTRGLPHREPPAQPVTAPQGTATFSRYDDDGSEDWLGYLSPEFATRANLPRNRTTWPAPNNSYQWRAFPLAVDGERNLLVTGMNEPEPGRDPTDFWITKSDEIGFDILWSNQSKPFRGGILMGLAVDAENHLLLTGDFANTLTIGSETQTSQGERDIFLAKLSPDGAPLWTARIGNDAGNWASDLALTDDDHALITGFTGTVEEAYPNDYRPRTLQLHKLAH